MSSDSAQKPSSQESWKLENINSPYVYVVCLNRSIGIDENTEAMNFHETLEGIVDNFPSLCDRLWYHPSLIRQFVKVFYVTDNPEVPKFFLSRCRKFRVDSKEEEKTRAKWCTGHLSRVHFERKGEGTL